MHGEMPVIKSTEKADEYECEHASYSEPQPIWMGSAGTADAKAPKQAWRADLAGRAAFLIQLWRRLVGRGHQHGVDHVHRRVGGPHSAAHQAGVVDLEALPSPVTVTVGALNRLVGADDLRGAGLPGTT